MTKRMRELQALILQKSKEAQALTEGEKVTNEDITYIFRLCDQNNIPYASNLATAEMLILGLARGDLDWRSIVNPKPRPFTT